MAPIRYTVFAHCPDQATADDFIAWLAHSHVAQVIAGGASEARIVQLDPETAASATEASATAVEIAVEYVFPSRAAFDAYQRGPAPALRAEGIALFVEGRSVRMSRTVGCIAHTRNA